MRSYGAGNAPHKKQELAQLLEQAVERGVVIVVCSQCPKVFVIIFKEFFKIYFLYLSVFFFFYYPSLQIEFVKLSLSEDGSCN